jgi:hypothetical protein
LLLYCGLAGRLKESRKYFLKSFILAL